MSERITAMDVENQQFKQKLRGYDPEEVSLYLKSVSEEIERLNLENAHLKEEQGNLMRRVQEQNARETTLQETLITAQKMSEEFKERSREQADQLIRDARVEAERTLRDAQEQLSRLEAEISRARLDRDLFEKRLRGTIEEHLQMLDTRAGERAQQPDNVHPMRRAVLDHG